MIPEHIRSIPVHPMTPGDNSWHFISSAIVYVCPTTLQEVFTIFTLKSMKTCWYMFQQMGKSCAYQFELKQNPILTQLCQRPWCQGLVPSSYTRCKDEQSYVYNIFKVLDEFWGCFWFGLEGFGGLINKRKIALKWATQKISSWNEFKRGLLTGVFTVPSNLSVPGVGLVVCWSSGAW